MGHLDADALDAALAGAADAGAIAHLDSCPRCQAEVEGLRRLVQRLRAAPVPVPAAVDRAILRAAARRLGRRRLPWRFAAAAILLVAVGTAFFLAPGAPRDPADVDGSGRVDIVDAYLLALRLKEGVSAGDGGDANADGVIDQRDVDAIARRSVALGESS